MASHKEVGDHTLLEVLWRVNAFGRADVARREAHKDE